MLDVRISGGMVVDGTGAPGRVADVGIRDGRIAAIGRSDEEARETLDARGRIVAPGFVDIHTHYDAQVFWDRTLSPSSFHGVTSVVGGNCGFSIAPLRPEAGDYLMRMLARVEGMPLESLRVGVPWDWKSFGEYLDRLEGQIAVNAGFMVGHSALRRVVMGERAVGERATEAELEAMRALLRESLAQGGLGFSSSIAATHNDGDGRPVPSRHASPEEIVALAGVLREFPGTALEFLPGTGIFDQDQRQLMTDMSLAANRPLNWNLLAPSSRNPEMTEMQLGASDFAAERGATVVALTLPQTMKMRINFISGFIFDALPGWGEVLGLPLEARKKALADPAVRERLERNASSEEAGLFRAFLRADSIRVHEVFEERNRPLVGRTLGEIARERGRKPFDVLLDLALDEDLRTSFAPNIPEADEATWKLRGETWRDKRAVIGASDAGAHLDMIDTFAIPTEVLADGVRERGLLGFEEAVHQLSDVPARLYGLRERGRLQEGWHADVVVFDPERVGKGPTYTRFDLPAGAGRLYADAEGIEHVLVNGVEVVRGTEFTGRCPGQVLRSGRDTDTVELPWSKDA